MRGREKWGRPIVKVNNFCILAWHLGIAGTTCDVMANTLYWIPDPRNQFNQMIR